jgi:hypothetical protein
MKTKQIRRICPNCAHSEFIEGDFFKYGVERYHCKKENVEMVVVNMHNSKKEIGVHGIFSKECLLFKQV